MSDKNCFVHALLYTESTSEVKLKIEKDLKIVDPPQSVAAEVLKQNIRKSKDDEDDDEEDDKKDKKLPEDEQDEEDG